MPSKPKRTPRYLVVLSLSAFLCVALMFGLMWMGYYPNSPRLQTYYVLTSYWLQTYGVHTLLAETIDELPEIIHISSRDANSTMSARIQTLQQFSSRVIY